MTKGEVKDTSPEHGYNNRGICWRLGLQFYPVWKYILYSQKSTSEARIDSFAAELTTA